MPRRRSCVCGVPETGTSCGLRDRRGFVLPARRAAGELRFVARPSDFRLGAGLAGSARSEPHSHPTRSGAVGTFFVSCPSGRESFPLDGHGWILRSRVVQRRGLLAADQVFLLGERSQLLVGRRKPRLGLTKPDRQTSRKHVDEQCASSRQSAQLEVARGRPLCRLFIERARRVPRPGCDDCDGRLRRPPLALVG